MGCEGMDGPAGAGFEDKSAWKTCVGFFQSVLVGLNRGDGMGKISFNFLKDVSMQLLSISLYTKLQECMLLGFLEKASPRARMVEDEGLPEI